MTAGAFESPCHVRPARLEDRTPIQRMLELYQHDLSDIWDQDLDIHGEYGYSLDRYGSNGECRAYLATVAGHYAGFALVDRAAKVGADAYWMDQFFVLKKYRRRGVGRHLARSVLASLPGRWEVGQMPENRRAQAFWRTVISDCTAGKFEQHEIAEGWWRGVVQCFRIEPAGA